MSDVLLEIAEGRGEITPDEVLRLRRELYGDHAIDPSEVAALWYMASNTEKDGPNWRSFLREVLADHYVHQAATPGVIDDVAGAELASRLRTTTHLNEALLDASSHVIAAAFHAPEDVYVAFFEAISAFVETARTISDDLAGIIRLGITAPGGDGHLGVTRREAEFLCDLNDLTRDAENGPAWADVFAKGVAEALTGGPTAAPPTADILRRRSSEASSGFPRIGGFLRQMVSGRRSTAPTSERRFAELNAERHVAAAANAPVTAEEANWLAGRLPKDGQLNPPERALIDLLASLDTAAALPAVLRRHG